MNWFLGLDKVWNYLDGYKTYLAGVASMLTGIAGILGEVIKLINDKSSIETLHWFQGLPQDQSWMLIIAGLAAIGLRHSNDKLSTQLKNDNTNAAGT